MWLDGGMKGEEGKPFEVVPSNATNKQ